jgi:hypothetical protein
MFMVMHREGVSGKSEVFRWYKFIPFLSCENRQDEMKEK